MKTPKTTEERALEILICAKELLARPGGWIKRRSRGRRHKDDGSYEWAYCVVGAIEECSTDLESSTARTMAAEVVRICLPNQRTIYTPDGRPLYERSIPDYNDAPRTTQKDVVGLLDRAIRKMRREVKKQQKGQRVMQ